MLTVNPQVPLIGRHCVQYSLQFFISAEDLSALRMYPDLLQHLLPHDFQFQSVQELNNGKHIERHQLRQGIAKPDISLIP